MNQDATAIAELRVLVGYLGEQQPAWWSSQFYSPSAPAFLGPVFSRTMPLAQYHGVAAAAARKHDEFIGVGQIFHLFRLPEIYEQLAAGAFIEEGWNERLVQLTASRETALARLDELAGQRISASEGPVVVGAVSQNLEWALRSFAALYFDAFNRGIKTYPYLRETQ